MVQSKERRQLMTRLAAESLSALGAVIGCGVRLAVLVVIAAGPWMLVTTAPAGGQSGGQVAGAGAAVVESRQVFEERRRLFDERRAQGSSQGAMAVELSMDD